MSDVDTSARDATAVIVRYKKIGLFGGLFLGAVVGIMVAGPKFGEWSSARSMLTILGSTGVGALIGYIAGEIATVSLASGTGPGIGGGTSSGGISGGGHGDGGGDGGGDS